MFFFVLFLFVLYQGKLEIQSLSFSLPVFIDSDNFVKDVFLCIGVIILIIFLNAWSKTLVIVIGMFKAAISIFAPSQIPRMVC